MQQWEKNIDNYLTSVPGTNIGIMITFCFLSMSRFNLLLDKILEMRRTYSTSYQRIWFDTPYLIEPPHLSALLTDDLTLKKLNDHLAYMKTLVRENNDLHYFTPTEYSKLERVVRWIEHNRYTDDKLQLNRRDFVTFVEEHDRRRGTSFYKTFPELTEFCNENR
jgi:hypothetical protein